MHHGSQVAEHIPPLTAIEIIQRVEVIEVVRSFGVARPVGETLAREM
jgi:hypothetical protein